MTAEQAIAEVAARVSNRGRFGDGDVLGTLNFVDDAKRAEAARLVRRGAVFSLSLPFDARGPQTGAYGRVNPVHTMLSSGDGAFDRAAGFPHGLGGADDVVFMPLQCSTHWDGLGHVFDHGIAYNGRRAAEVVTSLGDSVTGIEHATDRVVGRGVLLDFGELEDGVAIGAGELEAAIERQGSEVGRGDVLLVRTGRLARARREGWNGYAGGPSPGLSFWTAEWLHAREVAGVASDTWGVEVRPNELPDAFQPWHQVVIPHMGLLVGEMFDLDRLAADCAADGVYEFLLVAAPLPVTGAVGAPAVPIAIK